MNFRALSQPSVDHLLPYFEGVCEQFDASVILTLLNITIFFENGDQNVVSPGRWYALSGHYSVEKFAKCHHTQLSQAFPYIHWYLVAAHSLATLHPSQCSLCLCLTDWARLFIIHHFPNTHFKQYNAIHCISFAPNSPGKLFMVRQTRKHWTTSSYIRFETPVFNRWMESLR